MAQSTVTKHDPALGLWAAWRRAQHTSLVLCRVQQRLETRIIHNTGIQALTTGEIRQQPTPVIAPDGVRQYALAQEAEVLAMTEALKLQDALPEVAALSLAGILAKLEVIVGADRDIGDPTDFPWPHIASVLRDLKAIAGELPLCESNRSATRADIAAHLKQAAQLIDSVEAESTAKHTRQTATSCAETSAFPKPAEKPAEFVKSSRRRPT
ncbi:hypothetical protein LB519_18265 [Mesorhizobium sp. AD1-1]|uniref:hypothetical protein n=1 Tax=Mesorhizobium sp. AD1-1 TaxID=2876621 RepID=UPI001CC9DC14|nr:hypothetical protein [Mesorhizobium sp. AD1-1]MBZ9719792.1 hypothetical protein [Mesorhizobium sp. AD1-1]